jgi:hypothetical protein
MLVVLLAVSTFTFFTQTQQQADVIKDLQKSESAAKAVEATLTADVYKLKEWIGLDPAAKDDGLVEAEKVKIDDIAKFAASLPAEKQKYRFALEQTYSDLSVDKEKITQMAAQIMQLETVNKQFEEGAKKQVDEALAAKAKAEKDLAEQQAVFTDAQKKSEDEKKDLLAKIDTLTKTITDNEDAGKAALAAAEQKGEKPIKQLEEARETIKNLRGEGDVADDGEIRLVNQRNRTVWINLGRVDSLRAQTMFTVHSEDVPPSAPNATKAKIQVTKILGDHLSEARILEDNLTDPLIPGDKVYTALWDPGRIERFYLAGRMNVSGSGDGMAELRSIVTLSGGSVDGELSDKGDQTGTMTAETRYLVLGEWSGASKAKYDQLVSDAKLLGVEAIGIDKFLDHVGWKGAPGAMRFGTGRNVNEVARELPDGGVPASTNNTYDLFKSRRPPAAAPQQKSKPAMSSAFN